MEGLLMKDSVRVTGNKRFRIDEMIILSLRFRGYLKILFLCVDLTREERTLNGSCRLCCGLIILSDFSYYTFRSR